MTEAFMSIKGALASLSTDQYVAIFIAVIAISLALKVIKEGLSIVFTVVGILAALYFLSPDLYFQVFAFLEQLLSSIAKAIPIH